MASNLYGNTYTTNSTLSPQQFGGLTTSNLELKPHEGEEALVITEGERTYSILGELFKLRAKVLVLEKKIDEKEYYGLVELLEAGGDNRELAIITLEQKEKM